MLQPENSTTGSESRLPYQAPALSEFEVNKETATGMIIGPEGTNASFMYSPTS